MNNKIPLFLTVFLVSLIISIYNYDVLSTFVTEWHSGKHYFSKFIFVTLVLLIVLSLVVTIIIGWILKKVFQQKI